MEVITTQETLAKTLDSLRSQGKTIGLVPTMGALHSGHASLVRRSIEENDITVVSIFVNPTQFNDIRDLESYPRDIEADKALLQQIGASIAFIPSVKEMYPEPDTRQFSFPPVDTVMEGARRPGHFNGVCQIVSKLFYAVKPNRAYFGEKDFQQIAVIKAMVKHLDIPVKICPCPIVRQDDGLARSSRNALLTDQERIVATNIYKTLSKSREYAKTHSINETISFVTETLNAIPSLKVQYFEIVDGLSMQSVSNWEDSNFIVGCITVFCGHLPVRLIDNIKYKENSDKPC